MWAEIVKQLLIGVLSVYVLFGAFLFFAQNSLIYYPDNTPHEDCAAFPQQERYNTTRMHVLPGDDRALIVYHGNAGRACHRIYLSPFTQRTLIIVEYDGFAGQGRPSSTAHHQNVRDAHAWAQTQGFTDIAVLGESLGSGLAAYHAHLGGVSKVALLSPYRHLHEVAQHHYRVFPARVLLRQRYATLPYLEAFEGEILILHGRRDQIIPARLSEGLPGRRLVVDAGHNDLLSHADELSAFLD